MKTRELRRASVLAITLALALALPTSARVGDNLRINPPTATYGRIAVDSCLSEETLAGCKVKTFTLTNVGTEPILISGFGYSSAPLPYGDVGFQIPAIAPVNDCTRLPIVNLHWVLAPGATCTKTIAMNPTVTGKVEGSLVVSGLDQATVIARVPLHGIGF